MIFGIYPFGVAGTEQGVASGVPDDWAQIGTAITELSGDKSLVLRTYALYRGPGSERAVLAQVKLYAESGAPWDLVLCFQYSGLDLEGWIALIRTIVRRYGDARLAALQITNEPNLTHMPGDGSRRNVRQALVQGVLAARHEARTRGASLPIGFNAVPTVDPQDDFWLSLHSLGGQEFASAPDYVGFDIYPDVFGPPVALEALPGAVSALLKQFRTADLRAAGIPDSVPIRVTENGWPTGPGRPEAMQAQALEAIIRAVYAARSEFNVTHYELFGLRDADSAQENLFYRFGILRDDYSRKPAFETLRQLIAELA